MLRRSFLLGSLAALCAPRSTTAQVNLLPSRPAGYEWRRTEVQYGGAEQPGTVVVDTAARYLYLVQPSGRAIRWGIGVGREGFGWTGVEKVSRKAQWPSWRPPAEMIGRERKRGRVLPAHMPGGPGNPLGAAALYLGNTLYRIHGTIEPWSIGHSVSSGCFRMLNEHVVELYRLVPVGTKVVVR